MTSIMASRLLTITKQMPIYDNEFLRASLFIFMNSSLVAMFILAVALVMGSGHGCSIEDGGVAGCR